MEKTIETSSPKQVIVPSKNPLKISLSIEKNRYDIPVNYLFENAMRDNPKRKFLFVSRVLGKHIPINPLILRVIGALLGRAWLSDVENINLPETSLLLSALTSLSKQPLTSTSDKDKELYSNVIQILDTPIFLKERTLFIGFAETATGIAQAVFNSFENSSYIHTTREDLETLRPILSFKEEHSHAVGHRLFSENLKFLESYDRIVLVDDELTTGNTAINLIKQLPGDRFGIITILDWRDSSQQALMEQLANKSTIVTSLIKGVINEVSEPEVKPVDIIIPSKKFKDIKFEELLIKDDSKVDDYMTSNGRFGITSEEQSKINSSLTKISEVLINKRVPGNLLCLGTEEFIYIPCVISSMLGTKVQFHSTTRSPIICLEEDDYPIKNKISITSPYDELRKNYVYNIPKDFYEQVFLFLEKPISESSKQMFLGIFETFHIKHVLFIEWI